MRDDKKEWKSPKLTNHGEVAKITQLYCKCTGAGDVEITQIQMDNWLSCEVCPEC